MKATTIVSLVQIAIGFAALFAFAWFYTEFQLRLEKAHRDRINERQQRIEKYESEVVRQCDLAWPLRGTHHSKCIEVVG